MSNLPAKQKPEFVYQRRVEFADTDMGGILHFASFFRYVEEAEHAFLRTRGLSVVQPHENGFLSWPRVSAQCDYLSPARFGDVLNIRVEVSRIGSKSITYEFHITLGETEIANARIVAVCCEFETKKSPIRSTVIPAIVLEKLK